MNSCFGGLDGQRFSPLVKVAGVYTTRGAPGGGLGVGGFPFFEFSLGENKENLKFSKAAFKIRCRRPRSGQRLSQENLCPDLALVLRSNVGGYSFK